MSAVNFDGALMISPTTELSSQAYFRCPGLAGGVPEGGNNTNVENWTRASRLLAVLCVVVVLREVVLIIRLRNYDFLAVCLIIEIQKEHKIITLG